MMRKRILVVDDSAAVRDEIAAILDDEYECVFAANGMQGLARAARETPDVVLADVEMPEMDGVQMLRAMRANPVLQAIPVVIITSVTAVQQVNQCRALGCNGFVLKPLQPEYLRAKLRLLTATAAKSTP